MAEVSGLGERQKLHTNYVLSLVCPGHDHTKQGVARSISLALKL